MIRATDFRLFSVQAAVFTPQAEDFKPSQIIPRLTPLLQTKYDGEMKVSSAPKQIEIDVKGLRLVQGIQLSSEDGSWKVEIGPHRSDSYWFSRKTEEQRELTDTCEECLEVLRAYPISDEIQIGRLALIIRRWLPHQHAAAALAERFCKPELVDRDRNDAPFRNSQDFELHNRKRYQSFAPGVQINSWVRCRSNVLIHDQPAITIEHDINTLSEELDSRAFTTEDADQFFHWSAEEADRIVSKYFG